MYSYDNILFFVIIILYKLTTVLVVCGFEPQSGQTNDYEIGLCCFSANRTALRSKNKICWLGIKIMCQSRKTCLPTC